MALRRGIDYTKTKGNLRIWIEYTRRRSGEYDYGYKVYNGHLFVFNNDNGMKVLITMIKIPQKIMNRINDFI